MQTDKTIIIAVLIFSSIATMILAIFTWQRRKTVGSLIVAFTAMLISITIYSLGYAMELSTNNLDWVLFWLKIEHMGIQTITPLWLIFSIIITGNEKWLTKGRVTTIFIFPVISIISNLTNQWHHFFYQNPHLVTKGVFSTFHFDMGPIYWLSIFYINLMLVISTALFTVMLIKAAPQIRKQVIIYFTASIVPWIGMALYVTGNTPYNLDVSPIFLTISILIFAFGIFELHVLDIVPLAHDVIFNGMSDGVLVLDHENRIIDYNPALPVIFPSINKRTIGLSAFEVLKDFPVLIEHVGGNLSEAKELQIDCDKGNCYFQIKLSPVRDRQRRVLGKIISFHDVTKMKELVEKLQDLATLDGLTGVYNRRYFNELANREIDRIERYTGSLSLIMFDIDHFKLVNDTYGHGAGDGVLISVSKLCYGTIRKTDIFGRYGGEEFVILLPQTNHEAAMVFAERLRDAISNMRVRFQDQSISITASFGVVGINGPKKISLDDLLNYVDKSVYEAKQNGRNCVAGHKLEPAVPAS